MVRTTIWAGLLAGACSLAVHADSVILADGSEINGTIIEDNSTTVVIKRGNGTLQSFRKSDVDTVVYDTAKRPLSKGVVAGGPAKETPKTEPKAEVKAEPKAPEAVAEGAGPITKQPEPEGPAKTNDGLPPSATVQLDPKKAEPKAGDPKPADPSLGKTPADPKVVVDPKADPKKPADPKTVDPKTAEAKKEPEWTPPPNLAGFPDKAPRMTPEKEQAFMNVFAAMDTNDPGQRAQAKAAMAAFGPEVLPYAIAAANHSRVEARAAAMEVIGQLPNSSAALKPVIELMYSALPEEGEPASWQVPFLRACKTTLHASAGRSFISVEPSSALVQVGMKEAIKFYDENMDRLPQQITDTKLDVTDPQYTEKLKKMRALNLAKRSWPRPAMATDIVNREPQGPGRRNITAQEVITQQDDRNAKRAMPEVDRNSAINRGRDGQRQVDPRDAALNRKGY